MIDLRQYKINERMSNYNPWYYSIDNNNNMAPIAEIVINPGNYTKFDGIDFFFNDFYLAKSIFDRISSGESVVVNFKNKTWIFSNVKDYRKKFYGDIEDTMSNVFKKNQTYNHLCCELDIIFYEVKIANTQDLRDIEIEYILE